VISHHWVAWKPHWGLGDLLGSHEKKIYKHQQTIVFSSQFNKAVSCRFALQPIQGGMKALTKSWHSAMFWLVKGEKSNKSG
jgi:hypothetical protein